VYYSKESVPILAASVASENYLDENTVKTALSCLRIGISAVLIALFVIALIALAILVIVMVYRRQHRSVDASLLCLTAS
jgi:uncharacterized membrane protein YqjE